MLRDKGKFPVSEEFAPPEWIDTILLRFFIGFKRSVSGHVLNYRRPMITLILMCSQATAAAEAFAEMMDWY
jgi:hypothetical protein